MVTTIARARTKPVPIPQRVHPEWVEHSPHWAWLYDSWEGGERYKAASYGTTVGGYPLQNLRRHPRELPDPCEPGEAHDPFDDRLLRTPAPAWVSEAAENHLSKLFAREVSRKGPGDLTEWWRDVDGRGAGIDEWIQDVVAPLLLTLGQVDVQFDHPPKPKDAAVLTEHDRMALGLNRCVARHVLPQNVRWWRLDAAGLYEEVIIQENDHCGGPPRYRHWTAVGWTLYDERGRKIEGDDHGFRRVPVVRLIARRNPRCENVGLSAYAVIADLMREYYNRDSELILSDVLQAHPLIQGPEDYMRPDAVVPMGPRWLLPKKKNEKNGAATYEGFDVIEFPKAGAESIRLNKADLRDSADRNALLLKPAGAAGTDGTTVAQTGISKRLDQSSGNDFLAKVATRLQAAEVMLARFARLVLTEGAEFSPDGIVVTYPKVFDLATTDELVNAASGFQAVLAQAGSAPKAETEMLRRIARSALPGLPDAGLRAIDAEIEKAVKAKSEAEAEGLARDALDAASQRGEEVSGERPGREDEARA